MAHYFPCEFVPDLGADQRPAGRRGGGQRRGHGQRGGGDLLLVIGGYDLRDQSVTRRRVLPYGRTFRSRGYACTSRSTGLTCRRRAHGFFLSRARQSYL